MSRALASLVERWSSHFRFRLSYSLGACGTYPTQGPEERLALRKGHMKDGSFVIISINRNQEASYNMIEAKGLEKADST